MRSRYSAYVKGCIDYLIDTTHPQTRDTDSYDELRAFASSVHWLGLDVLDTRMGGEKDKVGKVEFVARYLNHGTPCEIHELSRFKKLNNRWLYLDGETVGKAEG